MTKSLFTVYSVKPTVLLHTVYTVVKCTKAYISKTYPEQFNITICIVFIFGTSTRTLQGFSPEKRTENVQRMSSLGVLYSHRTWLNISDR